MHTTILMIKPTPTTSHIHIIGGGLAGCEAAWHAANAGLNVSLYEMRPQIFTPAHSTPLLAELVCSNSFRSHDAESSAVGLLHEEMKLLGSLVMEAADHTKVPAGSALAVDRELFATYITEKISSHPLITLHREEISSIPDDWQQVIIATGPLTSEKLSHYIKDKTSAESFSFYDALSPIIHKDSINFNVAWRQSRYDKGTDDYINCPLTETEYQDFIAALLAHDSIPMKDWEVNTPYFEGCLPIEVMAKRGPETLRYGPMKPVGLTNPHRDDAPYAVVQLRQDNLHGTLWSMVGFQTKLRHKAQIEVFRKIPALEQADFARLGGIHRNSYINSPSLLDAYLRLKSDPRIRFAGQITGVEGYVESSAIGILAGSFAAAEMGEQAPKPLPKTTTAIGALLAHITDASRTHNLQPMNVNFGLFPDLQQKIKRKERKQRYIARARQDFISYMDATRKIVA